MMDTSTTITEKPNAVIWLEASLTASHFVITGLLSKQLEQQGFNVTILTSEDSLAAFKKVGGDIDADGYCTAKSSVDFGKHCKFVSNLASQKTYNEPGVTKVTDPELGPFAFIESPEIIAQRRAVIAQTLESLKPGVVMTELWPTGYGPFTKEITWMLDKAREIQPQAMRASLARDVPYVDLSYNRREDSAKFLEEKIDLAVVNGDGSIPVSDYLPLSEAAKAKIYYGGYYVTPLPAAEDRPAKERKVLVSAGSGWFPGIFDKYYQGVLEAIPYTDLTQQPWEILISDQAPKDYVEALTKRAAEISATHHMQITVRPNYQSHEFKKELVNAAFSISRAGSSMLPEALKAGVPAVMNPGIWVAEGGIDEQRERLERFIAMGAPVGLINNDMLEKPELLAETINQTFKRHQSAKKLEVGMDGPINSAREIAKQFILTHDYPDYQSVLTGYYTSLAATDGPAQADRMVAELLAKKYALDVQKHGHDYAYQMLADFHSNAYLEVLTSLQKSGQDTMLPPVKQTEPPMFGDPFFHGRIVADAVDHVAEALRADCRAIAGESSHVLIEKLGGAFLPVRLLATHFTPGEERAKFMEVARNYNRDRFEKGYDLAVDRLIEQYGVAPAYAVISAVQDQDHAYTLMTERLGVLASVAGNKEETIKQFADALTTGIETTRAVLAGHPQISNREPATISPLQDIKEASELDTPHPVLSTVSNLVAIGSRAKSEGWHVA